MFALRGIAVSLTFFVLLYCLLIVVRLTTQGRPTCNVHRRRLKPELQHSAAPRRTGF